MEPINCKTLLESISDYIDGQVDPEFCRELEEHLRTCTNCRVVVDSTKRTIYLYHDNSAAERVPSDVKSRLLTKLDLADYVIKPGIDHD